MSDRPTDTRYVDFDGHRLAYRVSGNGSAIVVLRNDRLRTDFAQARILRGTRRVVQIYPIGWGRSDRPPDVLVETMPEQVHTVADALGIERFVIWGYSQCAAMAACVARASTRTSALVCGGFSLTNSLSPATSRRLDRVLRPGHPSRPFWHWLARFDWKAELESMAFPRLLYAGAADFHGEKLRRARDELGTIGVDVIEFEGLTHRTCTDPPTVDEIVVPAVAAWLDRRLGRDW